MHHVARIQLVDRRDKCEQAVRNHMAAHRSISLRMERHHRFRLTISRARFERRSTTEQELGGNVISDPSAEQPL
jgi:hypothetical protein